MRSPERCIWLGAEGSVGFILRGCLCRRPFILSADKFTIPPNCIAASVIAVPASQSCVRSPPPVFVIAKYNFLVVNTHTLSVAGCYHSGSLWTGRRLVTFVNGTNVFSIILDVILGRVFYALSIVTTCSNFRRSRWTSAINFGNEFTSNVPRT